MKKLHKMKNAKKKRYCEEDDENGILDAILSKLFDKKSSTATPSTTPNSGNSMGGGNSFGNSMPQNQSNDDDAEMSLILQHMLSKENNNAVGNTSNASGIMDEITNFLKAYKK